MKYLKCFEDYNPEIGQTRTFVAKHIPHGFSYGSGFVVIRRDINKRFLGNIPCNLGTEITGEVVKYTETPFKHWLLKLEDGSFAQIDLSLFEPK